MCGPFPFPRYSLVYLSPLSSSFCCWIFCIFCPSSLIFTFYVLTFFILVRSFPQFRFLLVFRSLPSPFVFGVFLPPNIKAHSLLNIHLHLCVCVSVHIRLGLPKCIGLKCSSLEKSFSLFPKHSSHGEGKGVQSVKSKAQKEQENPHLSSTESRPLSVSLRSQRPSAQRHTKQAANTERESLLH